MRGDREWLNNPTNSYPETVPEDRCYYRWAERKEKCREPERREPERRERECREPECRERECREPERKKPDCCASPKRPLSKKILIACGNNPQDAIFEINHGYVEEHQSFILDRVLVDTSCFCKPLAKIEFSSLIFFKAEAKDYYEEELKVELLFELIRVCDGDEELIQEWKYLKAFKVREPHVMDGAGGQQQPAEKVTASLQPDDNIKVQLEISEPFTVTFCDRTCPGCCTYKMKVVGKKFEGKFEALMVVKPNLSVIAQDCSCD